MAEDDQFSEAIDAFRRGDLDRARTLAETGLGSQPSAIGHHLVGLIHCRQGNLAAGVEHLRAAASAEPGNPAFQLMLARALIDSGRAEEALELPEPPAIPSPASVALWQARAEAADSAARPEIAAEAWLRVAEAAPSDWRALGCLGTALSSLRRWPEAAEALAEAARLNPGEPAIRSDAVAALVQAGRQHQSLLRFDEAEAAFRRAHRLDPAEPATVHLLGAALERTNRLDDLRDLIRDSLAAGIDSERLAYLQAMLARREGRLDEAADLLGRSDPGDDPASWHALKSKIADALGHSGEAFAAAEAMNSALIERSVRADSRDEWNRRADAYRQEQRDLAATITPDWAARIPTLKDPPGKRVAFLLGFPRSGTTLLDTFLLGHPEVAVLEEQQVLAAAAEIAGPIAELPDVPLPRLEEARLAYLDRLASLVGAGFTGLAIDKFPLDMASAPLIHALFPGAPIIFAQRHPCDVVLSGYLQPFGLVNFSDIRAAADYYDALMGLWTASLEALPLSVHTIVYEELVADTEAVLKPLVAFLGLEWDDRILDHRRTAKSRGTIVTPSYDQVTEPVTARSIGRWTRYRKQLEPVLPVLLPWAEKLGYRE